MLRSSAGTVFRYIQFEINYEHAMGVELNIPRFRCSTFGIRDFSVAGPTVWNSLPDSLRDPAVESERFRKRISAGHLRHERIRGVSVSRNCAIQIDIYLLTYLILWNGYTGVAVTKRRRWALAYPVFRTISGAM